MTATLNKGTFFAVNLMMQNKSIGLIEPIDMNKVILTFYLLLLPYILIAQSVMQDSTQFKADLSITGFWQSGNVQTWIFRGKSEVSYKWLEKWEFKTRNSYLYQEFGRVKADEDILSLNFLSYNPEGKVYPLALGFISTNFRREIDLRYLIGAGSAFRVLNTDKTRLTFSLTGEYENTNFRTTQFNRSEYNGNRSINTYRGTIWINGRYKILNNRVILTHESFFQQSLEQSNNFRWQADLGIELPVNKHLNFKINFLETYESIVVANQLRGDEFLTFGLTVKSY
jgi:hypothetical protein